MSRLLPKRGFRAVIGLFTLVGTVLVAGCASHAPAAPASTGSNAGSAFPVTVTVPGGNTPVTIATEPKRIVSLDASESAILHALGADKQVVAVDKDSDYPGAPVTSIDSTNPNVEAIAGKNPDLVITAYDNNNVVSGLKKLRIPVLLVNAPKNINEAYALWSAVGRATGHQSEADTLVARTKQDIAATVARAPKPAKPLSYYYELDSTYYTATSHTFIGSLLGQFQLTNIGDPADSTTAAGYPQLSQEAILQANPSVIFLADGGKDGGQTPQTVAARPGWATLSAVQRGDVFTLDSDQASEWGPSIDQLMHAVADDLAKAGK
ncbi:MAG TPA: ABC transporter substrate-binding protein [Pseudonocardiaceae bacterium]|nr:ABC transporter substrate-binding protein [Pseudonocardiaceae bacterium]